MDHYRGQASSGGSQSLLWCLLHYASLGSGREETLWIQGLSICRSGDTWYAAEEPLRAVQYGVGTCTCHMTYCLTCYRPYSLNVTHCQHPLYTPAHVLHQLTIYCVHQAAHGSAVYVGIMVVVVYCDKMEMLCHLKSTKEKLPIGKYRFILGSANRTSKRKVWIPVKGNFGVLLFCWGSAVTTPYGCFICISHAQLTFLLITSGVWNIDQLSDHLHTLPWTVYSLAS